ncbi:MAG: hypothetical protein FH748_01265 [Balneolaceae bacterium]|nr:hypothetical protein [Balneolaceae bacterium]
MKNSLLFAVLFSLLAFSSSTYAQFGEPAVQKKDNPRSLFNEGYTTGFGISLNLSDFGFGAGAQFRKGIRPYNEALITFKIASLKDPSEQTFVNYSFGFRTIPNKYQRAISFPLYFGLKKRFFAKDIADNFRVFSTLSAGPVFTISYPYFSDVNNNGFRENDRFVYGFEERVNDIFSGFNESETHWGIGGETAIGIDFGENFSNLSTIQFGFTMNYYNNGIQILEPQKPVFDNGVPQYNDLGELIMEEANAPRKYFGSAQITFVFGWMW